MQSSPASKQNGPPGPGTADLQARVDELDDRYKRALADLDNYRKRSERLADSRVADARDRMLRDWLDAVDSVETALDMTSADGEVEGLEAVRDQMRSILERQGVQRFGAAGEGFDPDRHEAIAARESDAVPDRSIVDVVRAGYMVGDRVLRPARVIVSRRPDGES
jgi:molecular chaperone GrpE